INIEADWSSVTLADQGFGGRFAAIGNASEVRIRHRLQSPFELATEGSLVLGDAGWLVDVENRWNRIDWQLPSGQRLASRDGRLHVAGNVADYRAEGALWIRVDDWPEARIELGGVGDLVGFAFDPLRAESTAGRVDVTGRLRWSPDLDWDADIDAAELDLSLLRTDLAGTVDATARSAGRVSGGTLEYATLALERLDGTFLSLPASASGELAYANQRLDISNGRLALGSSRATVSGRAGTGMELDITVDAPAIGELLAEASGAVSVGGQVGGTPGTPTIDAEVRGERLSWQAYSAERIEARLDLAADQRFEFGAAGSGLGDGRRRVEQWTASASGSPAAHRIDLGVEGTAGSARLAARGGWLEAAWSGEVEALEIDGPVVGRWTTGSSTRLRASADAVDLGLLCLDRQDLPGRACAEVDYAPGRPLDFAVSVAELPLAALPLTLPPGVGMSGDIFVEAAGEIAPDSIDASTAIEVRNASVQADIDGETETVRFTRLAGNAGIVANRLDATIEVAFSEGAGAGHVEFGMEDVRNADSPINGLARLGISDLSLVELFVPGIREPVGTIAGAVTIAGVAKAPALSGRIELSDGRAAIPAAGTEIRDLQLALEQREPGSLSVTGHAVSGDGSITIDGRTRLDPETGLETDITISGEDFDLLRLPDMQASASPDVRIHVDTDEVAVKGGLLIPNANFVVQEIPAGARKPSGDAVVMGREVDTRGGARRANVDIDVTLGDGVSFAGFGLTTDLTGNLRVQVAPSAPVTGLGRISLVGGRYEAYGQDLEIERGELIFSGPINNPLLDLRAVRRMPDVTAGIHVTGTPSQLSSEIFSEPAMSEVEALSYLLTGHALATADMGEGDLMNKAAFALGMSQAGAITSQVRSSLGLETLTLQGGIDDSRIVAGKRIGGRLLVEYGYGLVDQLGTLILKYQVNERLVLESSTGSVSTLDIIYKVRRK
ncbi:MAG: translocation/assembly module TamB domain-containing protein, partial [Gammaproteobacteria bacterium]|nr:translocation/assembly module TamB domain-containing protein [Gammaproteobacteria bacterium]